MPQYMLLLGGTDKNKAALNREITIKKYQEWTERLMREGRFKDAHKLRDGQGRKLTMNGDELVDGPFSESKETVGGYYLIEAKDYEDAVSVGKSCPILVYQGGYVEVREIEN